MEEIQDLDFHSNTPPDAGKNKPGAVGLTVNGLAADADHVQAMAATLNHPLVMLAIATTFPVELRRLRMAKTSG